MQTLWAPSERLRQAPPHAVQPAAAGQPHLEAENHKRLGLAAARGGEARHGGRKACGLLEHFRARQKPPLRDRRRAVFKRRRSAGAKPCMRAHARGHACVECVGFAVSVRGFEGLSMRRRKWLLVIAACTAGAPRAAAVQCSTAAASPDDVCVTHWALCLAKGPQNSPPCSRITLNEVLTWRLRREGAASGLLARSRGDRAEQRDELSHCSVVAVARARMAASCSTGNLLLRTPGARCQWVD